MPTGSATARGGPQPIATTVSNASLLRIFLRWSSTRIDAVQVVT